MGISREAQDTCQRQAEALRRVVSGHPGLNLQTNSLAMSSLGSAPQTTVSSGLLRLNWGTDFFSCDLPGPGQKWRLDHQNVSCCSVPQALGKQIFGGAGDVPVNIK